MKTIDIVKKQYTAAPDKIIIHVDDYDEQSQGGIVYIHKKKDNPKLLGGTVLSVGENIKLNVSPGDHVFYFEETASAIVINKEVEIDFAVADNLVFTIKDDDIKMFKDYCLVVRDSQEQTAIITPDQYKKDEYVGTVLASNNVYDVQPGDKLLFSEYGGAQCVVKNKVMWLLHRREVIALIQEG